MFTSLFLSHHVSQYSSPIYKSSCTTLLYHTVVHIQCTTLLYSKCTTLLANVPHFLFNVPWFYMFNVLHPYLLSLKHYFVSVYISLLYSKAAHFSGSLGRYFLSGSLLYNKAAHFFNEKRLTFKCLVHFKTLLCQYVYISFIHLSILKRPWICIYQSYLDYLQRLFT